MGDSGSNIADTGHAKDKDGDNKTGKLVTVDKDWSVKEHSVEVILIL